jgi:hypothetical protein
MGIPPELLSPEKQTQQGFTEPAPPSPSTYLDLPLTPHVNNATDDLSYISHNLYHQSPNHPMFLNAEQPFAQILSAYADALTTWARSSVQPSPLQSSGATPKYYYYCDMIASEMLPSDNVNSTHVYQDASSGFFMNTMHEETAVEPNRLLPAKSSSMDMISMAFFKGMEEANKLLPSENDRKTLDHGRGRKKRLQVNDDVDVGMGRSSKQKAAQSQPDSEEEAAACEMLDRLMLNNEPSHASMQQELLSSMELEKPRARRAGASHTVDLHALLIRCAEAVATNDLQGTVDLLQRIRHHSSPTGDGTQRLAHCFTQGLEARLLGTGNQMYKSLLAKCGAATSTLRVYQMYMAACSILPVSFLLSNKIMYNAIAGRKKLHIVHYGLGHGFHLQANSLRRQGAASVIVLVSLGSHSSSMLSQQN